VADQVLILEQQRRHFVQAAAPGLEFVTRVRRDVRRVLDADLFEGVVIGQDAGRALRAAATAKHDLDLVFEGRNAVVQVENGEGVANGDGDGKKEWEQLGHIGDAKGYIH